MGGDDADTDLLPSLPVPTIIRSQPLSELECQLFHPGDTDPFKYRFIDCNAFLDEQTLRLCAFDLLPVDFYSAISYVWKGLLPKPSLEGDQIYFQAAGAEDAGKINMMIMRQACRLSIIKGAPYMWLDCICIKQNDQEDKTWQIAEMPDIYSQCKICIIIPGGLQRLIRIRLAENSNWATRHWTMQEAVLPKEAVCLFWWSLGAGKIDNTVSIMMLDYTPATQDLRGAAYCSLQEILDKEPAGRGKSRRAEEFESVGGIKSILTNRTNFHISNQVTGELVEQQLIKAARSDDWNQKCHAVWTSIYSRASSRPVDAILSHMGLLGITLDTTAILRSKFPRLAATIKLAQEYLKHGGKAVWLSFLAAHCRSPKEVYLVRYNEAGLWPASDYRACTFLHSQDDGTERHLGHGNRGFYDSYSYKESESAARCEQLTLQLRDAPSGVLDDFGYLTIEVAWQVISPEVITKYLPLHFDFEERYVSMNRTETAVVHLGLLKRASPRVNVQADMDQYVNSRLFLLVTRNTGHSSWYIFGTFISQLFLGRNGSEWKSDRITLGGPQKADDLWSE